jgi:hypothetical protein
MQSPLFLRYFRLTAQIIGWFPPLGGAVAMGLGLALVASAPPEAQTWPPVRIVEAIVPLGVALQAAFILAPDSEAPLEMLCALRRPLDGILLNRMLTLLLMQFAAALAASAATMVLPDSESFFAVVARWLSPSLFVGGLSLFTVQLTRQGVFGALMTTLLWGGLLFGGDAMVARWPFTLPFHIFLQPASVSLADYVLNRCVLLIVGVGVTLGALYLVRDEERVLGLRGGKT